MKYNLLLMRLYDNGDDTLGIWYFKDIDGNIKYVFSIEDEFRTKKKYKETRIPAGQYKLFTRKDGRHYDKYSNHSNLALKELTRKYGILQLADVPNFTGILIHLGNDEKDTAGCLLPGSKAYNNSFGRGYIAESTDAYIKLASAIFKAMDDGADVYITIIDKDREIRKGMEDF